MTKIKKINKQQVFFHIWEAIEELWHILYDMNYKDNTDIPFETSLIHAISHLNFLTHTFNKTKKEIDIIYNEKIDPESKTFSKFNTFHTYALEELEEKYNLKI